MEHQNNDIAELKQRQAELQDWLAQNPTPCLLRTLKSRHLTDVNNQIKSYEQPTRRRYIRL